MRIPCWRIPCWRIVMLCSVAMAAAIDLSADERATHNLAERSFPARTTCRLASEVPVIDGRLDEPVWQSVKWSAPFVDIRGGSHPAPPLRTRMKLLWDKDHLYIAADLEEPHVWGTVRPRDAIVFHDNDFEVFIDPNGDGREYYEVEINALNTIFDLFLVRSYNDGGPALHGWDLKGLKTAVHVNGTLNDGSDRDDGWQLEMALPWSALKEAAGTAAPPRPNDVWRMNFSRVEWQHRITDGRYEKLPGTREENWVWSPQGKIN
ncbi:MAG: carbohydrate-binding family 9-like protein, partial [Planctomycetota bacterium]